MVLPRTDSFRTSDTVLAAYLISAGCNTPGMEFPNGNKAYFVFSQENFDIDPYVNDFNSGRATGNIVVFMAAYQNLIRRIKERY
jgi:hypothetical protein